jgi:ATP-dependent DNA helicase RecG
LNSSLVLGTRIEEPTIEERENSVLVTIKHEALASPEQAILEYLETNSSITNRVARGICHINADYAMKNIFNRLASRKLIQKVPGTDRGTTAYQPGPAYAGWRSTAGKQSGGD